MRLHELRLSRPACLRTLRGRMIGAFGVFVAIALIPVISRALLQQNTPPNTPRNVPEFLNRQPDFSDQVRMRQNQMNQQNFDAVNALRRKQVTDDSARLIKLADELKTEIDSNSKDTVSQNSLRKIEAIEKLARSIKQKMSVSVLPN
jgi:hypothetical protein